MLVASVLLALNFSQRAAADDNDPPGRVARLSYRQGPVSFQPAGETDWVAAVVNRPMTTGDRLWVDSGARAELHIGSATIRLDANTGFSFLNLDDRTVQIQLTGGTLNIRVQRLGRDETFEVDTPNQAFSVLRPGQYRFQASEDGNSTFVTVRNGEGEATGGGQIYAVHSGQSATFTGADSLYADIVNAGGTDEFDNWSLRRDRHADESRSARYVSPNVVGYEDLDDNGSWRSDPTYGNVWTPRVSAGWAPYHDGHWAWISPWGWTWIDDAPWGYAPFHYGRWVSIRESWCWVPGPIAYEPVYAPALVVFIGGSHFGVSIAVGGGGYDGNVGWFPLGPREVYVPGYNVSRGYVNRVNISNTNVSNTTITNVYNTQVTNINTTNITYVNKTIPGAVTAVPHGVFTNAQPVAKAAVPVNAQQIAAASVSPRAVVAPTRNSVLGPSAASASRVAQPPAAIASRPVVAKATPPPPPVPFAKQQQELAAHPGQPLAQHEVQSLRPANAPAVQPLVKQAPPGKPGTPNINRPSGQPVGAKQGQAAPQPTPQPASEPKVQPEPEPKAQPRPEPAPEPKVQPEPQPTRTDRPPSVQPKMQPEPQPKEQPRPEPRAQPEPERKAQPRPEPAPEPKVQPEPKAKKKPEQKPKQKPKKEQEPKPPQPKDNPPSD